MIFVKPRSKEDLQQCGRSDIYVGRLSRCFGYPNPNPKYQGTGEDLAQPLTLTLTLTLTPNRSQIGIKLVINAEPGILPVSCGRRFRSADHDRHFAR